MIKITPELKLRIAELYVSGVSTKEIAKKLGIGHSTLFRALKEINIERRRKLLTDEEKERIVKLYTRDKLTINKIAKIVHRNRDTVKAVLKEKGVKVDSRPPRDQTIKIPNNREIIAYIAGLFDGEGCISLKSVCHGRYRQPEIKISNTNYEVMQFLLKNIGGRVRAVHKGDEKRKPLYDWRIRRRKDIYIFLSTILPYLIIKREKAEKLLMVIKGELENRIHILNSPGTPQESLRG